MPSAATNVQGLGDASTEGEVSGVPPQDADPNAGSRGVDSLGTVAQLPAAPAGPPPPVPPPAPPYLAGLGSYGDVTAADVGAYPVRLQAAPRSMSLRCQPTMSAAGTVNEAL